MLNWFVALRPTRLLGLKSQVNMCPLSMNTYSRKRKALTWLAEGLEKLILVDVRMSLQVKEINVNKSANI